MSMFNVDYSNAGAMQVTPGFYEAYVSDYQISTSRTNNQIISLFYTIRDDVNQPCQGGKISYDNFNVIPNSKWRMDAFARAVGIPNGTPINSAEEWANMMLNKDVVIKVVMGTPNANGNSYPEAKEFHPTQAPNQGRPMPVLEKAFGNNNRNNNNGGYVGNASYVNQTIGNQSYGANDPHRPADNAMGYGGNGGYGGQQNQAMQQNHSNQAMGNQTAGANQQAMQSSATQAPTNRQNALQQAAGKIAQGGQSISTDNRSFANGGFDGADINDDDLPF